MPLEALKPLQTATVFLSIRVSERRGYVWASLSETRMKLLALHFDKATARTCKNFAAIRVSERRGHVLLFLSEQPLRFLVGEVFDLRQEGRQRASSACGAGDGAVIAASPFVSVGWSDCSAR